MVRQSHERSNEGDSLSPWSSDPRAGLSTSGLPADLLEDARRRLGWACGLYAAAFTLAYFMPRWAGLFDASEGTDQRVGDLAAAGSIALALVLAASMRLQRGSTRLLLTLGLVFEVVGAAAISVSEIWWFYSPGHLSFGPTADMRGISWVCVWILVFPLLVPATGGRAALASFAAAATGPLVLWASYVYHGPEPEMAALRVNLTGLIMSNAICAGLAVAGSRVIYRLGRQIREARRLGSYRLVERLGKGGMGEVWLAEHRLLARPAAVKLVRADGMAAAGSADRVLRRFEREAQATAQLRCPHSINLYDFGVTRGGTFYYVMELLEGLTLEELVERFGPIPAERAIHLLIQTCRSLEEAHGRGLIHRDIKPANIFCCRYGLELDFVKVLDFGLVKAYSDFETGSRLTAEGTVAGTPAYMAPESVMGEVEVDARADLYAVGCVAYWLLTGTLVFEASSPMRVAIMHVDEQPIPPSARTELSLPAQLDQLVLDCLAKSPARRPESAAVLRRRLEAVPVASPWTQERASEWWAKHVPQMRNAGAFVRPSREGACDDTATRNTVPRPAAG